MKTLTKHIAIFIATFALIFTSIPLTANAVATPPKVKTFYAKTQSTSAVRLTWTKPGNASGYAIYVNGKLHKRIGIKNTAYDVTGLKHSTNYKFAIRTYNAYNVMQYYNSSSKTWQTKKPSNAQWKGRKSRKVTAYKYSAASVTRTCATAKPVVVRTPGTVSGVTVSGTTTNSVTIKWNKLTSNCTGYQIYVNDKFQAEPSVGATSYTITKLSAGTQYTIKIRGYLLNGNGSKTTYGAYSTVKATTTKPAQVSTGSTLSTQSATPTPATVTGLKVTAKTTNSVTVTWNKLTSNCTWYEVYLNDKLQDEPGATITSYTMKNLSAGTQYTIKVRGCYIASNGKSTYGGYATTTVTTEANAPAPAPVNNNNNSASGSSGDSGGAAGNAPSTSTSPQPAGTITPPPSLPSGRNTTGGIYDQRPNDVYTNPSAKYNAVQWAKNNIPSDATDAEKVLIVLNAVPTAMQVEGYYNCIYDATCVVYMLDYVGVPSTIYECRNATPYVNRWSKDHVNNLIWIDGAPYVFDVSTYGNSTTLGGYYYLDGHIVNDGKTWNTLRYH